MPACQPIVPSTWRRTSSDKCLALFVGLQALHSCPSASHAGPCPLPVAGGPAVSSQLPQPNQAHTATTVTPGASHQGDAGVPRRNVTRERPPDPSQSAVLQPWRRNSLPKANSPSFGCRTRVDRDPRRGVVADVCSLLTSAQKHPPNRPRTAPQGSWLQPHWAEGTKAGFIAFWFTMCD